jgi:TfoX/Sxy family transcriptional regulator of competence genes
MAFDAALAARIRGTLARRKGITEKRMFGGLAFFLHGNICVGVWHDSLIARVGPEEGADALREPHVGPFAVTGRPMANWVLVAPEGVAEDGQLADWIERAMRFVRRLPRK